MSDSIPPEDSDLNLELLVDALHSKPNFRAYLMQDFSAALLSEGLSTPTWEQLSQFMGVPANRNSFYEWLGWIVDRTVLTALALSSLPTSEADPSADVPGSPLEPAGLADVPPQIKPDQLLAMLLMNLKGNPSLRAQIAALPLENAFGQLSVTQNRHWPTAQMVRAFLGQPADNSVASLQAWMTANSILSLLAPSIQYLPQAPISLTNCEIIDP